MSSRRFMASGEHESYELESEMNDRKGKKKMFRSQIHKAKSSEKLRDMFEFQFSNLQVLQVPRGWDKLFVSIISMETGKSISRTGKASVQNGNCLWVETLSDYILVSLDDALKENEACLFKLVVAMGSIRFGTLGEATINVASYISSTASFSVSLPLEKCQSRAILRVKIQCLTPRTGSRGEQWRDTSSNMEEMNVDYDDMENKSDVSENAFTRSVGSSSANLFMENKSASALLGSFDSIEGPFGREKFSPESIVSRMVKESASTHDAIGSVDSSNGLNGSSRLNNSPSGSKVDGLGSQLEDQREDVGESNLQNSGSSKDLLDAAEVTIELLHAEARKWEQNSQKLTAEVDRLQNELFDQSKHQESLETEVSASRTECDSLKQEIEQVKMLEEKQTTHTKDVAKIKEEWEMEMKSQKELNASLALQLKKSQEANLELVSILQELEDTMEKQQMEIINLSMVKSESEDMETCSDGSEYSNTVDSEPKIQADEKRKAGRKGENAELQEEFEADDTEILKAQLQQMQESLKNLESTLRIVEETLEEKNHEIEIEQARRDEALMKSETEWRGRLAEKERDAYNLERKLCEAFNALGLREPDFTNENECDLRKEIEVITEKLQELERDRNELEDENVELRLRCRNSSCPLLIEYPEKLGSPTSKSDISEIRSDISKREEELKKELHITDICDHNLKLKNHCADLEERCADLELELQSFKDRDFELEDELLAASARSGKEVDNSIQKQLESSPIEEAESMDSQVSANKEAERSNSELEVHLSEFENENIQLTERICGLEAVLRYLTDEKESNRLALQSSQSHSMNLAEKVREMEMEMEAGKLEVNHKIHEAERRRLEALEESEYLRIENAKLQAIKARIVEECSSLQTSNADLRTQMQDLDEHCTLLEAELRESRDIFSDIIKEVAVLETKFSSMQEEVVAKEKDVNGKLDALLQEIEKNNENLAREDSRLNQMYLEKTAELDKLQRKVLYLIDQMSETYDEKERAVSEALLELYCLREDKALLESALQEAQEKVKLCESNCEIIQKESEAEVAKLISELEAAKQNHEVIMADHRWELRSMEDVRIKESERQSTTTSLELKLKAAEHVRLKLSEEISSLKIKLQKRDQMEDEIWALKKSLCEAKLEYNRLKVLFEILSEDYEELKAKRISYLEKISVMQKESSEIEDCKHRRAALEEKVFRLEWDLSAKESACVENAKMKNELARIKIKNSEFKKKIEGLEEEKEECLKRVKLLAEKLKQMNEVKQDVEKTDNGSLSLSRAIAHSNCDYPKLPTDDDKHHCYSGGSCAKGLNPKSKVKFLEKKVAEALVSKDKHKNQLKSSFREERNEYEYSDASEMLTGEDQLKKEGEENVLSSL